MEFLGASFVAHIASGGSGADGWSGSSFGAIGTGAAYFSNAADLLKQLEPLMAKAKTEKISQRKY